MRNLTRSKYLRAFPLFWALALSLAPVSHAGILQNYQATCPGQTLQYRHDGLFRLESDEAHHDVKTRYDKRVLGALKGKKIERFFDTDLSIDLNKPDELRTCLKDPNHFPNMDLVYYLTSGAGLWTRGGKRPKALVPFNLFEILGREQLTDFERMVKILSASTPEAILAAAHVSPGPAESREEVSHSVVMRTAQKLEKRIAEARSANQALTPLDVKFVNVAIESSLAHTYIPFDIWTSEQTHEPIRAYVNSFRRKFDKKRFHPVDDIDRKIHRVLREYFLLSERFHETHLFGYQEGFHEVDAHTGEPMRRSGVIGAGAGAALDYLRRSGRIRDLERMGKTVMLFDNIEVATQLNPVVNAHFRTGAPVSVVLVPVGDGYSGGSPYLVDGHLLIVEGSAIPAELKDLLKDNKYFNSNTFIMPLTATYPAEMGFELRNGMIRQKVNMGDVTHLMRTAGIGGRQGWDYIDLKTYQAYADMGPEVIRHVQAGWAASLAN